MDRRSEYLVQLALERWPWHDKGRVTAVSDGGLRWRIGDGRRRGESAASQMVLNVAAARTFILQPDSHLELKQAPSLCAPSQAMTIMCFIRTEILAPKAPSDAERWASVVT